MVLPVLNFPASPAIDDRWPVPVVTGQPQYRWDGTAWLASDAPEDATDVSVAEDQTFTETQKAQGRENIYAAPFDALSYNGMQINGSFDVSQEIGGAGITSNGYFCDGWLVGIGGSAAILTQAAEATHYFSGFRNFGQISVTTAQTSLGANDVATMYHRIEGHRITRLAWGTANAKPITIGFWSSHAKTGLYSVAVRNVDNSRSYVAAYTQVASNVQQYNAVTVTGCPDGTWLTDGGVGMTIDFTVAAGANLITVPGVWTTANKIGATGQVNGVDSTSNFFRVTGVVVLPGIEAPSAERSPLIMGPTIRNWRRARGITTNEIIRRAEGMCAYFKRLARR